MSEGYIQGYTSDSHSASNSKSLCAESEHTKQIRHILKLENEADQNLYKYMLMRRGVNEVVRCRVSDRIDWVIRDVLEGIDRELNFAGTLRIPYEETSSFLNSVAPLGLYDITWYQLYHQETELAISSISTTLHKLYDSLNHASANFRDKEHLKGVYADLINVVFFEYETCRSFDIISDVQTIYRMISAFDLWPVYVLARDILVNLNDDLSKCWFPYVLVHLNTGTANFNKTRLENDTSLLIALKISHTLCTQAWQADHVGFEYHSPEMSYVYGTSVLADWVEVVMGFMSQGQVTIVPIFASPMSDPAKYLQFVNILFKIKDEGTIRKSTIENWLWCLRGMKPPISVIQRIIRSKPSAAATFQPFLDSAIAGKQMQARLKLAEQIDGKERMGQWLKDVHKARHPYDLSS